MIPLLLFPKLIKKHPFAALAIGIILFVLSSILIEKWRTAKAARQNEV